MDNPTNRAPVILLIHGATLNGRMWDPVRRHLDPRLAVLAPDLPGHGTRRAERYTIAGAVATVVDAARSVAPAPVMLAGDSLGGYSSLAAAGALPQAQLQGLVIGGATFNFDGAAVMPYVLKGALFGALAAVFGEQRVIGKSMAKALTAGDFGLSPADARTLIEAGMSVTVFREAVRAIRPIDWRAKLAAITQPVVIVNGDQDTVNVREEASFLACAQQATSRRFDCKHGVSLWRSAEFAGIINDLARRVFDLRPAADASAS